MINIPEQGPQDRRPRLVRHAEQQLRQGWQLVINHERRTATWQRGADTLNGAYSYAEIVEEMFSEEFPGQIRSAAASPMTILTTIPPTTTSEETMTTIEQAKPGLSKPDLSKDLVFTQHRHTMSELEEITGLSRYRIRDAHRRGYLNAEKATSPPPYPRPTWYVQIDDAFVAWMRERQMWTGEIILPESDGAASEVETGDDDDVWVPEEMDVCEDAAIEAEIEHAREVVKRVALADTEQTREAIKRAIEEPRGFAKADVARVQEGGVIRFRGIDWESEDLKPHTGYLVRIWALSSSSPDASLIITEEDGGPIIAIAKRVPVSGGMESGDGVPGGWTPEEIDAAALEVEELTAASKEISTAGGEPEQAPDSEDNDDTGHRLEWMLELLANRMPPPIEGPAAYRKREIYRDERTTEEWLIDELATARGEWERANVRGDDYDKTHAWRDLEKAEAQVQRHLQDLDATRQRLKRALKRRRGLFSW